MFRDRRKSRRKMVLLLLGVTFLAAFVVGYYLNYGNRPDNHIGKQKKDILIPDNITNMGKINHGDGFVSADINQERVKEYTVFHYITSYKMCGHTIEKNTIAPQAFIGLNKEELERKIEGWIINEMTEEQIIFIRDIETFCPRHFIISTNDDNIAIYTYNENGERILKEKTDIDINILTPEDQLLLQRGIVADTEDDMELKIEGFSN